MDGNWATDPSRGDPQMPSCFAADGQRQMTLRCVYLRRR